MDNMMNGHTSNDEDFSEKMKQSHKDLKEKNLLLEGQIAKYEIDLSQKMEILLKTKQELDKVQEKCEAAESENFQLKEKVNSFQAQIYQLQELKMKKVEEDNMIVDLQRNLSAKERILRKLKGDFENITVKLSEKKRNMKKLKSTNKRLWNLIAEFESALSKAGLLSSKQKKLLLKEHEEETVSSDAGTDGDVSEHTKALSHKLPASEVQPSDKSKPEKVTFPKPLPNLEKTAQNESPDEPKEKGRLQDNFLPLIYPCSSVKSYGSNYFMKSSKDVLDDPHVSDDCLDISNSELKDLRQQISLRTEPFTPISPLPPTPPPKSMKSKLQGCNESLQMMKSSYKRLDFCHQQSESFDIQSELQSYPTQELLSENHDSLPSNGKYTISTKRNLDGSLKFDFNANLNTHLSLDVNTFQVSCTIMPTNYTDFSGWKHPTLQTPTPETQKSSSNQDQLASRKEESLNVVNHEQMSDISTSTSRNASMSNQDAEEDSKKMQSAKRLKQDSINEISTSGSPDAVSSSENDKELTHIKKEKRSISSHESKIGTEFFKNKTSELDTLNCKNKEDLVSAFSTLPVSAQKKRKQTNTLTSHSLISSEHNNLNAIEDLHEPCAARLNTGCTKNDQTLENSENVSNTSTEINNLKKKRKQLKRKDNSNKNCSDESFKECSKNEQILENSENVSNTSTEVSNLRKKRKQLKRKANSNKNYSDEFFKEEETLPPKIKNEKRKRLRKNKGHSSESENSNKSPEKLAEKKNKDSTEEITSAFELIEEQDCVNANEVMTEDFSPLITEKDKPDSSDSENKTSDLNSKCESATIEDSFAFKTPLSKDENEKPSQPVIEDNCLAEFFPPVPEISDIQMQTGTELANLIDSDFTVPINTTKTPEKEEICNDVDLTGISVNPFGSSPFMPRGLFTATIKNSPKKPSVVHANSITLPNDTLISHSLVHKTSEDNNVSLSEEEVKQSSTLNYDSKIQSDFVMNGVKTDNENDDYESDHSLVIAETIENNDQMDVLNNDPPSEMDILENDKPLPKKSPNKAGGKKGRKKKPKRLTEVKKRNVDCKTSNYEQISIPDAFKILDQMKYTDEHFKQNQHTVTNAFINPKNASSSKDVVYDILKYLSVSRANPLLNYFLSDDPDVLLPAAEKCITSVLLSIGRKFTHRLYGLIESVVETAYELVLAKEKFTIYGLSSICRVLTEICKQTKNKKKPLLLCSELLKIQHKFTPYLIASIASVWQELFDISDLSDEEKVFHSSLSYGVHKKSHLLTEQHWKHCCKLLNTYLKAPHLTSNKDTISYLIKTLHLKCISGTLDDEYMLTTPLITLAAIEGWEWAKESLIDEHIIPLLVKFSEQESNEQGFQVFCHLYVDICNFCPDQKDIHEVLMDFFYNQPEMEGNNFIKDTVAMAQMKFILLKKQLVPPHLAEWIGENQDNKEKADYAETLFRRRLMVEEGELLASEIL